MKMREAPWSAAAKLPPCGRNSKAAASGVAHTLPCMYAPYGADIESNVGATHATQPVDFQEQSGYNGHFESTCYHSLQV